MPGTHLRLIVGTMPREVSQKCSRKDSTSGECVIEPSTLKADGFDRLGGLVKSSHHTILARSKNQKQYLEGVSGVWICWRVISSVLE
jgi:hypothetical protein